MIRDSEILVRGWRVRQSGTGADLWFNPATELVKLFHAPPGDSVGDSDSGSDSLDRPGELGYLDKVGSVSALESEARVVSNDLLETPEPPVEWLSTMWLGFEDG